MESARQERANAEPDTGGGDEARRIAHAVIGAVRDANERLQPFEITSAICDAQGRRQVARAVSDGGPTMVITAGTGDPDKPIHLVVTRRGAEDLAALLLEAVRQGT